MKKPNLGNKRTCKKCAARFFDLNNNPAACPKCGEEIRFTKPKAKRPAEDPPQPAAAEEEVVKVPEAAKEAVDGDEADDLEAELEGDQDEDDLMEDTSDIGEDKDDMTEVLEHVDDGVADK